MTVLEQRFMEIVPRELQKLNENLQTIINLLKEKGNGEETK